MKLTPKQEAYLSRFMRDVNMHLEAGIPDTTREAGLKQVQRDIYQRLAQVKSEEGAVADEALFQVLREMGRPESIAQNIASTHSPRSPQKTSSNTQVWLGVCAWLADQLDQDPRLLRIVVFLVGLVTGPFALLAYLAFFSYLYFSGQISLDEAPSPLALFGRLALYNGVTLLLHVGVLFFLHGINVIYEMLLGQMPPELDNWNWLLAWRGWLLFWMLAFGIPLSLLGGLPLANGWAQSLRRFLQALIALYAILLCFGIASILVGLLLDSADDIRPFIG